MEDIYISQSSTTSQSAWLYTHSSSSFLQRVTCSDRMNRCSNSSQSNLSSSYPSGKVNNTHLFLHHIGTQRWVADGKTLLLCRNGSRHPRALRRHTQCPCHRWKWSRGRHGGSWLAELHYLHWNVLCCHCPPICLHVHSLPGEKKWRARWEL